MDNTQVLVTALVTWNSFRKNWYARIGAQEADTGGGIIEGWMKEGTDKREIEHFAWSKAGELGAKYGVDYTMRIAE